MSLSGYRRAESGDDLTEAVYRPLAYGGREAWVPAEPLGWSDARPEWLRRAHHAFTAPEVSWWFDVEGALATLADGLDNASDALDRLAERARQRGRAAQRRRGVNR